VQLYAGSSKQFIEDAVQNQIAEKLKLAFNSQFRFSPSPGEVASWRNSLSKLKDVFQRAKLTDHGVVLEYQLPLSSKRLDCMVTGNNSDRRGSAVIVELKQWEKCEEADGENEVTTWTGHGKRSVLHPSVQVGQYEMYLRDTNAAFHEGPEPVDLHACSYLHNYTIAADDLLRSRKYRRYVGNYPLFSMDDVDPLCNYLDGFVSGGDGMPVLQRVVESRFRASKKLLEHVGDVIKAKKEYILLDEQLVVYDEVFAAARKGFANKQKTLLLVKGGPGTGKSVIALNLMADLSIEDSNAHYATGSKSFTETLRKIVGSRASAQFKYFNSYGCAEPDELDVLILDEAHRIRKTSVNRFTPKTARSGKPQIEELLNAAKVSVFFIDDLQGVRPDEVGSTAVIREAAAKIGCRIHEYELEAQFRCAGSDAFVNWIDNTLGIRKTANILWQGDERFEFKVFESPAELEAAIRQRVAEGSTARMTAGFCWPWSNPDARGSLVDDVVIGDFRRPWNAKPEATRLAKGIPKASLWAFDPTGINQVGCVYTAQGFEFDYVGVIFGRDLIYNPTSVDWEGRKELSHDKAVKQGKERFADLVKRTYRVLLSRGMKGCYVHFMDRETRDFFMSRIEAKVHAKPSVVPVPTFTPRGPTLDLLQEIRPDERFTTHLPVYSLAVAAGGFSEGQSVRPIGWAKVSLGRPLQKDMFIARVAGASMEPTVRDGSWCVFQIERGGSRDGKVVLVQSRQISDPETGHQYTIKRYRSEKELFPDGTWRHKRIVLSPDNNKFADIVLDDVEADSFSVVAELVQPVPDVS